MQFDRDDGIMGFWIGLESRQFLSVLVKRGFHPTQRTQRMQRLNDRHNASSCVKKLRKQRNKTTQAKNK